MAPRLLLMLAVALWPDLAQAGNCEAEARATQRTVRSLGTGTPGDERAIGQARVQCRDQPARGRSRLDDVRRDAGQRPSPAPDGGGYRSPTLDPAWRHRND